MQRINELIEKKRILLSDGAWGTLLQEKGLKPGDSAELWNIKNEEAVFEAAKSYIDAGSDMIETNSFGGNRLKLAQYGLEKEAYQLNKKAAEISRSAAGKEKIVLGSIGSTGKFLMMGDVTEEELYNSFQEQAAALQEGGADAICIETFYAIDEAELAIKAAKENTDLEVICTFTFEKSESGKYHTMMGVDPIVYTNKMLELGVDVIGTNCGNGFEGMVDIVKEIKSIEKEIPILVHANAGLPIIEGEKIIYPETPEIVVKIIPLLIEAGANIIGGCCGTGPNHIKAIREVVDRYL